MTRLNARILLAAALLPALSGQAAAAVGSTTLEELVVTSDVIVIGTEDRVVELLETKVAVLRVEETLKGPSSDEIFFLTDGIWEYDCSEAVPGERVLLFLNQVHWVAEREAQENEPSNRMHTFDDWAPRPGFGKALAELKGEEPLLRIGYSGLGRMPLRTVDGVEYATLWVDDVLLPSRIETIPGPEEEFDFIRSAPLQDLEEYVRALVDLMRKWRPELE